jgi:hypothetical protein
MWKIWFCYLGERSGNKMIIVIAPRIHPASRGDQDASGNHVDAVALIYLQDKLCLPLCGNHHCQLCDARTHTLCLRLFI